MIFDSAIYRSFPLQRRDNLSHQFHGDVLFGHPRPGRFAGFSVTGLQQVHGIEITAEGAGAGADIIGKNPVALLFQQFFAGVGPDVRGLQPVHLST